MDDEFQSPYVEYVGGNFEVDVKKTMVGIAYGLFILLMILVVFKIISCMSAGGSRSCKMRGNGWGWPSRNNTSPMSGGGHGMGGCPPREPSYIACEQPPLILNPYGF